MFLNEAYYWQSVQYVDTKFIEINIQELIH